MTSRNTAIAFALALSALFGAKAGAQEAISLFVMPIARATDLSQAQADLIEDTLVSGLLSTGSFSLNARARSAPSASTSGNDVAGTETIGLGAPALVLHNDADALRMAAEAGATLVLFTRATLEGRTGGERSVAFIFRLVGVDTGKDLHLRSVKLPEAKLSTGLMDEAKRIAVAAKARSDITVEMIDSLIKAGDWETAQRFLATFLTAKPAALPTMAARAARINQGLAAKRYTQAREASALGLYEEARRAAAEASSLDPESLEYRVFQATLDDEYARYLAQSAEERLTVIANFLEQGRVDIAATLLERAGDDARASVRGQLLAAAISRDLEARKAMLTAEGLLKEEQFPEALAAIDQALRLKPDHSPYLRLRIKILEAEKRRSATLERFSAYRAELDAFDYAALLYSRKPIPVGWAGMLGFGSVLAFDPAELSWTPKEWGSYPSLELRHAWPLPWYSVGPFSFTEARTGAQLSAGALSGIDRTSSSMIGAALLAERTAMFWLGGGAHGSLEFLSMALRLDAGLEVSYLSRLSEHLASSGAIVSSSDLDAWTLGGRLGLDLVWAPRSAFALSLGVGRTWPLFSTLSIDAGAPTRTAFRLGIELGSKSW